MRTNARPDAQTPPATGHSRRKLLLAVGALLIA